MNNNPIEKPVIDVSFEQSLTAPPNTGSQPHVFNTPISNDIESALSQLININEKNILHEPTCIICSDPNREEIEKKWAETTSHDEVKKLFKSRSSYSISKDIIDNHIRFHYEKGIKELQKVEYTNKIKRLNSVQLTTLDRIQLGLATLTERLMGINSITSNNDISATEIEQIKSAETARLMGAFNNLLKLQASIMGEMKDNGELIIIPSAMFIDVFNRAIIEAKTDAEKEAIKKILNNLANLNKKTQ